MTMMQQVGFDTLLAETEAINKQRVLERETAHLPSTMEDGIRYYRHLLAQHHEAMLRADLETIQVIREDATNLAKRLNGGKFGILAHEHSSGCILERETAAAPLTIPLWGQIGDFIIDIDGVRTRIQMEGMIGMKGMCMHWQGFSIRAVDTHLPFFSDTGFRSFTGVHADIIEDWTPDIFVTYIVREYRRSELKGRLVPIAERWR
ncbi:hypothetical protein NBRC116494_06830 [Aurantivibrio plasticivorans]